MNGESDEVEIANLSEINEYFRIFKDEILRRDADHRQERLELKLQLNLLKAKLQGEVKHTLRIASGRTPQKMSVLGEKSQNLDTNASGSMYEDQKSFGKREQSMGEKMNYVEFERKKQLIS